MKKNTSRFKYLKLLIFLVSFFTLIFYNNKINFYSKINQLYHNDKENFKLKLYGLNDDSIFIADLIISKDIGKFKKTYNKHDDSFEFHFQNIDNIEKVNIKWIHNIFIEKEIFEKVAVKKNYGNSISVKLTIRDFIAKINLKYSDQKYFLDSHGIIYKISEFNEIFNSRNKKIILGCDIVSIKKFLNLYNFLQKESMLNYFSHINEIGNHRFNLITKNDITIKLPEFNWDKSLLKIKKINNISNNKLIEKNNKFEYIDLRFKDRIIYKKTE